MLKHITMALFALFLFATSHAQVKGASAPGSGATTAVTAIAPSPPTDQPKFYRPSGCDTLLTQPTETYFCSCNCVTFNPKWITDATEGSIGLNVANLANTFDIQMPPEIFQSGRLIGLDSDGPLFFALFSMPTDNGVVTTRFAWRYMCRSGAFFLQEVTRKMYNK